VDDASDSTSEPYPYPAGPKQLKDGRVSWVMSMTFGKGRLIVGKLLAEDGRSPYEYEDGWCYETLDAALQEHARWDGEGEPSGWMRHPFSGRRRPGGDASKEHVRP
jgi:hypothetical protein